MFCEKCGGTFRREKNQLICEKCGAVYDIDYVEGYNEAYSTGVEYFAPRGFSSKRNIIIIVIAALVVLGGIVAAVAVGVSHSASQPALTGIQLAEKYLSEQNYEQAIIAFDQVLEIEPMNVDAYLGLSEAYIGKGDTNKALEVLRKGLEMTRDARLQAKIDELTKLQEPVISSISSNISSKPAESKPVKDESKQGTMGSVIIKGVEYDIATTTGLHLIWNSINDEDLKEIAKLKNLTELDLSGNEIADISPLAELTNLTWLDLGGFTTAWYNRISDISPLAGLTNLTYLDLSHNEISNITPLKNLTNLTHLCLYVNKGEDIAALVGLTGLTYLDLGINNFITDISPLAGLVELEYLNLMFNRISDVTPIAGLTKLKTLNLEQNKISASDKDWLKAQLPNCEIEFN